MKILNKKLFLIGFFILLAGLIFLAFNRPPFYYKDITFWSLYIITVALIFLVLQPFLSDLLDKIINRYLK